MNEGQKDTYKVNTMHRNYRLSARVHTYIYTRQSYEIHHTCAVTGMSKRYQTIHHAQPRANLLKLAAHLNINDDS